MDQSWRQQREQHERLRWARMHCTPFGRPTDAARSLNIKPGTYRTYELHKDEGGRVPPLEEAVRISKKFGVSWIWIVTGEGAPDADDKTGLGISLVGTLTRDFAKVEPEKQPDALRAIEGVIQAFSRKAG